MGAIKLGDEVRDRVSGFTGVACSIHTQLYSSSRVEVVGPSEGSLKPEEVWFEEGRLIVVARTNADK